MLRWLYAVTAAFLMCTGGVAAKPSTVLKCGVPGTPAAYLLEVVHDIAANGDLTDRKSLETILETKFDAHPVTDGPEAGHRVDYSSVSLFGHPAAVDYTLLDDPGMQKRLSIIAVLRIKPDPSQITLSPQAVADCLADLAASAPVARPMKDAVGSYWTERLSRVVPGGSLRLVWKDPEGTERVSEIGVFLDP